MPTQPTTRAQISGYNFMVRRMEHAIVRRDVRMLHDPMRSQSRAFTVGIILAALGLAAMGVLALLKPQDKIADNKILVGKDSGAMYVVLGDTIHPALNLASAKLAAGDSGGGGTSRPKIVKESELGKHSRGQLVGIPGAPSAMPTGDKDGKSKIWTVCDVDQSGGKPAGGALRTTVIVGDPALGDNASVLGRGKGLLVQAGDGSDKDTAYLAYRGTHGAIRAKLDIGDPAVIKALSIDSSQTPRPVSTGLLNAIPEVTAVSSPRIDAIGTTPSWHSPDDMKVGAVVYTNQGESKQYYVVLRDGLQAITAVVKDMIRNTNSLHMDDADKITPDAQTSAPVSHGLDAQIAEYPQGALQIMQPDENPVSCLSWKPLGTIADRKQNNVGAELSILSGRQLPLAKDAKPVPLAQSDGSGTKADTAYVHPGTGDFVLSTGIERDSKSSYNMFYISDSGLRYQVKNADSRKALGLDSIQPELAPDPIVRLLGYGPTLGREEAMVAHDGVQQDPNAVPLPSTATAKPGN